MTRRIRERARPEEAEVADDVYNQLNRKLNTFGLAHVRKRRGMSSVTGATLFRLGHSDGGRRNNEIDR